VASTAPVRARIGREVAERRSHGIQRSGPCEPKLTNHAFFVRILLHCNLNASQIRIAVTEAHTHRLARDRRMDALAVDAQVRGAVVSVAAIVVARALTDARTVDAGCTFLVAIIVRQAAVADMVVGYMVIAACHDTGVGCLVAHQPHIDARVTGVFAEAGLFAAGIRAVAVQTVATEGISSENLTTVWYAPAAERDRSHTTQARREDSRMSHRRILTMGQVIDTRHPTNLPCGRSISPPGA
jgi:hypothetical protein